MKKLKLKQNVKEILFIIICLLLTIAVYAYVNRDNDKAIQNCVEQGISQNACERELFGVY